MTAEDLRKAILQQAIQGKLLPQDPNDEPASKLLERIREEKARLVKEKKIKKDKNESFIYRGEDNSHYEKFADGTVKCIDDEIPFEIPQSWEWCRLGDLFQHNTGKALNSANNVGTLKKYLTTSNVYWNRFDFTTVKEMYFKDDEIEKCSIRKGDLLVCEGGDIGRTAIWDKDDEICIQNHIHRLRVFIEISTKYIYYIFWFFKRNGVIGGKGIGIQGLSANVLHNILIPLPPLNEQFKIVSKLETILVVSDKYEEKQNELDKLESELQSQLKKSILQYAIQGKLVTQIPTDEPAIELLKRINKEKEQLIKDGKIKREKNTSIIFKGDDNKYFEKKGNNVVCINDEIPFEIPDSWVWIRFKNLVQFSLGKTPERVDSSYWNSNDCPWVSIADMEDKTTLSKTKECISQKALKEKFGNTYSPIGTLIMSFKLTIGKVSILGIDAVHNEAIISIFPFVSDENITRDYLFNFLSIITGYTTSTDAIKGATLNSKKISEMLVPLPPLQEQKRIVMALDNVLTSIMRN